MTITSNPQIRDRFLATSLEHPRIPAELLEHLSPTSRAEFSRFGIGERRARSEEMLHRRVGEWALRSPATAAVVDAEGSELSYAELDARSTSLAIRLRDAGVRRGDRVAVVTTRSTSWVVSLLAVLKAGATWIPQDARIAARSTLEHIVRIAGVSVVLTRSAHARSLEGIAPEVWAVDALDLERDQLPDLPAGEPGDVATIIFTSGTTGTPHGVQVTHANLANVLLEGPASLGIGPGMRVAQLLNIAFDMSVWEVFGALLHGATLLIRSEDIQATAEASDVLIATPSVLAGIDESRCSRARIVAVAGERCPEDLAARWRRGRRFHNSCGPTEVTIVNTVHALDPGDQLTIGSPLPNTSVYVLDEQLRPVETGQIGEMWAGGDCVTLGYLGEPDLTAGRYRPDPFLGGRMFRCRDLVSWTPDGRLLHHGRTDDQVKVRGGFRVELDGVTSTLETCAEVAAATTILQDGALTTVVVSEDPSRPAHAALEGAMEHLREHLPYYSLPERIVLADRLPMTDRGKVDRGAISTRLAAEPSADLVTFLSAEAAA